MYDYAKVQVPFNPRLVDNAANPSSHVVYTIPVAIILTGILWPLWTRLDLYKICFLVTVAVTYTIPWDSYLIRNGIWSRLSLESVDVHID